MNNGGIDFGLHFSVGYSPWIICCSDSIVRGMLVELRRTSKNKLLGNHPIQRADAPAVHIA